MLDRKPQITLQDLEVFYYVVKQGSFLRGAEALNIDQGKASRSVARLEQVFCTMLLYRDMRNIALTKTGDIVFKMAQEILERFHQGRIETEREQKDMAGPITLSVAAGFGNYWLMPRLKPFVEANPDIDLIFKTDNVDNVNLADTNLMLGTADIHIVSTKPEYRDALEIRLLCEYPLYIYASKAYLEKRGVPQRVEDLDHHTFITFQENLPTSISLELFNRLLHVGRQNKSPRKSILYIDGDLSVMTATVNGFGLALLSDAFGQSSSELQRVHIEDEDYWLKSCVNRKYMIFQKSLLASVRHKKLIDHIEQQAKELTSPDLNARIKA